MQTFEIDVYGRKYVWDKDVEGLLRGSDLVAKANRKQLENELGVKWEEIPQVEVPFLEYWVREGERIFPDKANVELKDFPAMLRVNHYLLIREDIYKNLKERFSNYPLLNEEVYSEMEHEAVQETWESIVKDEVKEELCRKLGDLDDVEEWLDEHFPEWEEVLFELAQRHGEIIVEGDTAYITVKDWDAFIEDFKKESNVDFDADDEFSMTP